MKPGKSHRWNTVVGDTRNARRCWDCGLQRRSLPIIGVWRPWPDNCQG